MDWLLFITFVLVVLYIIRYRKSLVEDAGLFDFNMLPSSLFDEKFYLNSRNVDVFSL